VGAAEYDPRANHWTAIAAPPMLKGQWAVTAAGRRQVVLVLNTGATYSWRPTTGRWQPLGTLPAGRDHFSVAWTGSSFLVTGIYRWKEAGPGQAFELTGHRLCNSAMSGGGSRSSTPESLSVSNTRRTMAKSSRSVVVERATLSVTGSTKSDGAFRATISSSHRPSGAWSLPNTCPDNRWLRHPCRSGASPYRWPTVSFSSQCDM
jgi:hypothetical protein